MKPGVLVAAALLSLLMTPFAATARSQETANAPAVKTPAAAVVNLNTATAAQLEALPGIGAKTAQRIIEYRQKSGGFKKIEDLMNVKGVGEKSFLKLKSRLTVTPPKEER